MDRIRTSRSPSKRATPPTRLSSSSSSQTRSSNVSQAYSTSPKAFISFPSFSPEPDAVSRSSRQNTPQRKASVPVKSAADHDAQARPRSQSVAVTQSQNSALNRTMKGAAGLRKSIMAALTGTVSEEQTPRKSTLAGFDEESDPLHKATDEYVQRLIANKGGPVPTVRQYSADVAESNFRVTQERNNKQAILEENRNLRHENEDLRRRNIDLEQKLDAARDLLRKIGSRQASEERSRSPGDRSGLDGLVDANSLHSFSGATLEEKPDEPSEAANALLRVISAPVSRGASATVEKTFKTTKPAPRDVAPPAPRRTAPRRSLGAVTQRQKSETLEMKGPVDEEDLPPALREIRRSAEDGQTDRLGFLFTSIREQRHVSDNRGPGSIDNHSMDSYPGNDVSSASSVKGLETVGENEELGTTAPRNPSNGELLCYAPVAPPLRLVSFGANGQQKFVDILKAPARSASTSETAEATVLATPSAESTFDFTLDSRKASASSLEDTQTTSTALSKTTTTDSISTPPGSESAPTTETAAKTLNTLLGKLNSSYDTQQNHRLSEWKLFETQVRASVKQTSASSSSDRFQGGSTTSGEREYDYAMSSVSRLCTPSTVTPEIMKRFHTLLAMGVPLALRQEVWLEKTGANAMRVPGLFETLLSKESTDTFALESNGTHDPDTTKSPNSATQTAHDISADVERTLTHNTYFRHGAGRPRLSQVLTAYSHHNPSIGYSQGLNIIAANLLLLTTTAEDAFWLLVAVINTVLPSADYYSRDGLVSSLALETDGLVLKDLLGSLLPKLHAHLSTSLGIDLTLFTPSWFISAFAAALQGEALFRFWDLLLGYCDGRLVFCVALALLKVNRRALMGCESYEEGMVFLGGKLTSAAVGLDVLIKEVLRFAGEVNGEEIKERREKAREVIGKR